MRIELVWDEVNPNIATSTTIWRNTAPFEDDLIQVFIIAEIIPFLVPE